MTFQGNCEVSEGLTRVLQIRVFCLIFLGICIFPYFLKWEKKETKDLRFLRGRLYFTVFLWMIVDGWV